MQAARSIPRAAQYTDALTTDILLLAALIAGEARGEPYDGQVAVACVARNRVNNPGWWGRTWREVILKPKQFSPFNVSDSANGWEGRDALVDLLGLVEPQHTYIAAGVYHRRISDNTNGATHFANLSLAQPGWADDLVMCARFGRHTFYKAEPPGEAI